MGEATKLDASITDRPFKRLYTQPPFSNLLETGWNIFGGLASGIAFRCLGKSRKKVVPKPYISTMPLRPDAVWQGLETDKIVWKISSPIIAKFFRAPLR